MKLSTATNFAVGLDRIVGRAAAAVRAIDRADRLAQQITPPHSRPRRACRTGRSGPGRTRRSLALRLQSVKRNSGVEIPTAAELRRNNPWLPETFNITRQAICPRQFPDLAEELKAAGENAKTEIERRKRDTGLSWQCLIAAYPQIRSDRKRLGRQVGS